MDGLISHTKATEMAAVYARNTDAIIQRLEEIAELRAELKSVFFDVGAFDFTITSSEIGHQKERDDLRKIFKRQGWRTLIEKLELRKYMSSNRQEELNKALYDNHRSRGETDPIDDFPEITEDSIIDVLMAYANTAHEFLDESIRTEWEWWIPRRDTYKANAEKWKVSKKIIHTSVMSAWDKFDLLHRVRYDSKAHVSNLDNIFHLLDGKGFIKTNSGPLLDAIDRVSAGESETEYFRAKMFKNGNLHLWVKRDDLLDRFNEVGCGDGTALPNPTNCDGFGVEEGCILDEPPLKGSLDFFPTPERLSQKMVQIVVDHHVRNGWDERKQLMALEPSAGVGSLAFALANKRFKVYCIEADRDRAEKLDKSWDVEGCEQADFLKKESSPVMSAVVMNPPFSMCQDIHHVYHASKFVARSGILVAVMSPHWTFSNDKRSVAFRQWVNRLDYEWSMLPPRSFAESGTNVSAGLMVIRRPKLEVIKTGSSIVGQSANPQNLLGA